jgi:pilus assembly protein FimV
MARVVLAALALLGIFLSPAGHALGLGEIQLRSALGQPFAADIPLAVDAPDELRDLKVVLAPPETFARFGLDRPPALADLRFAVAPGATPPVIRVTSTRPVSEPFISLLLEVSWAKGRLLREYTVLLDPPTFDDRAATPAMAAPPVAARPAAPRPVERAAPAPAAAADPGANSGSGSADSFGPVQRGDTLSAIASRLQPGTGASLNQVMLALYRANPEAFVGNINRLKAGAILRVPSGEAMTGLTRADADGEVRRQVAEWREGGPAGPQSARLQLVPPSPGTVMAGGESARIGKLEAELAESRRLLELRSRELKSLQQRLGQQGGAVSPASPGAARPEASAPEGAEAEGAEAEGKGAEAAVERLAGEEPAQAAPTDEAAAPVAGARARRPQPARPPAAEEGGLVDSVLGAVFNQWFLGGAALILLGAYLLYRRRAAGDAAPSYGDESPDFAKGSLAGGAARDTDSPFLVEEGADASETMTARAMFPPADLETPLERTISTEGGAQLDQSDAIAEADFHSAYGLYDQAADILNRALRAEPGRRDLRLKLIEVCFSWENRPVFLDEARAFRALVGSPADPDWNKVAIMGRQLCPGDPLFAEAGGADAGLDFSLTGAGTALSAVDLPVGKGDAGARADLDLDLDFTGEQASDLPDLIDFDLDAAAADQNGRTAELPSLASTMETPTIEAMALGQTPTMETPTLEVPAAGSATAETPTIESLLGDDVDFTDTDAGTTELPAADRPAGARTVETPTLESVAPGWFPGAQRRFPVDASRTEEINLEDLGLDLTGLDEAATGLGNVASDFDLGDALGADSGSLPALDLDTGATGRLSGNRFDGEEATSDTAEQPRPAVDDTAEQPRASLADLSLDSAELAGLDFDLADETGLNVEPTASLAGRRGPEGPTMTEVGTKLDLARAYIDMGDPDGARSILNEVLEEGDPGQRQEARKLLTELPA